MNKKPKKRIADQIVESLQEFVETLQGGADIETTFNCRRVVIDAPSTEYDENVVKATRKMLAASQAIFAQFLGVSVQTVRAWEQGENVPSEIAKRFMDEIRHNPDYWRQRLREVVVPKKRKTASQAK
jgi:putative transcriptional regulator